jgi:hypothetical protein
METFIVRVWMPSDSLEGQTLRGVVEQVGSGSETAFVDEDELLAVLRAPKRQPNSARQVGGTP